MILGGIKIYHIKTLEFDTILNRLAEFALSAGAKKACLSLLPAENITQTRRRINETTQARQIIELLGNPPTAITEDLHKIIILLTADALLSPEQIYQVGIFAGSCRRMKDYLKRAETTDTEVSFYGNSLIPLTDLEDEINRCIRNMQVDDRASTALYDIRRSIERKSDQIKNKVEDVLQKNKQYCAESFFALRAGRYTIPVKKEHRHKIPGVLVEISNTGSTCFIEPEAVRKLQDELGNLLVEEDNEVRIVLYTLTALIHDELKTINHNMEAMETLDFLFAKAKLSREMKALPIRITEERQIRLLNARHPLINAEKAVPMNFSLGGGTDGIVITGPNTGGKTVTLKTVGLLSLMALCGLHIPADDTSSICMFDEILCDIGDGQSISENLSTFSSHMTNIIGILEKTDVNSLILFDELGSGTDPAEGMGIAMAILEELLTRKCLFTATTHYPEIKDFAANTPRLINARMAFDKESLLPLYKLEIGEAGESCALHIAKRLGFPNHLLLRAEEFTYSGTVNQNVENPANGSILAVTPLEIPEESPAEPSVPRSQRFNIGDSVMVYPKKELGIVYARATEKGEVGVQIKGIKRLVNHKRLKLKVAAEELYPDDYDFSIIFDTAENRKARHLMDRKHVAGNTVKISD